MFARDSLSYSFSLCNDCCRWYSCATPIEFCFPIHPSLDERLKLISGNQNFVARVLNTYPQWSNIP